MVVLFVVASLILFGSMSVVFAMDGDAFKEKFYAPVELMKVVEPPKLVAGLTEEEMKSLLEVKQVLSDFMKDQRIRNATPMDYLTKEKQSDYKDRVDLYRREFGEEAYLEFEIYEFKIKKQCKEIVLFVDLTATTEGVIRIPHGMYTFIKTSLGWKISEFGRKLNTTPCENKDCS